MLTVEPKNRIVWVDCVKMWQDNVFERYQFQLLFVYFFSVVLRNHILAFNIKNYIKNSHTQRIEIENKKTSIAETQIYKSGIRKT